MNSRERVLLALNHLEPDRVPLDLGGSVVTGMHVDSVYQLRQALKLDPPGTPVKVVEIVQMLGEIKPDLLDAVGADVAPLRPPGLDFGLRPEGWKPWRTFSGTPVLVPGGFNTGLNADGSLFMYPLGDTSCAPSALMPAGGYYFDALIRQKGPLDDADLKVEDNLEEFTLLSDDDLQVMHAESIRLESQTDKAILLWTPGTAFGNIARVPGINLPEPRGIRDTKDWYTSLVDRPDFINEIFRLQCDLALQNLPRIFEAVGNRPAAAMISGTDFGAQNGPFISPRLFRSLFLPHYLRLTEWIRAHTAWKIFIHTCGSVTAFLPDLIDAGFDILNPVQTSAARMDPQDLKSRFGAALTFWGGGVDTQKTLPFGSPAEVRAEVADRIRVFGPGGGFVFNPVHNLQAGVPVENMLAMYRAVRDFGSYPLSG